MKKQLFIDLFVNFDEYNAGDSFYDYMMNKFKKAFDIYINRGVREWIGTAQIVQHRMM